MKIEDLRNANLARYTVRTRRRPRGRCSTFDYEDQNDDESDTCTLHPAICEPQLNCGFYVVK